MVRRLDLTDHDRGAAPGNGNCAVAGLFHTFQLDQKGVVIPVFEAPGQPPQYFWRVGVLTAAISTIQRTAQFKTLSVLFI